MKISKSQLRRIIREERASLLERRDKHAPFWPAEGSLQAAKPWLGKAQGRPMMGVGSLSMFQTPEQAARGVANDDYHPDNPKFGPKVEVPVDAPIDWSLYAGHPSLKKNPAPKPPYDVSPASNTGVGYVADDSPIAGIENKKAKAAGIKEPKDAEDYEVGRDEYKVEGITEIKITKRQLRRIIKEEKAKVLAEQKIRRIVRRRLMESNPGFEAWKKLPEPGYKTPERDAVMNADPYYGNRELPDSHSKGHVSIDRENNVALDGNLTKMTPDEVMKKFGDGYSLRGAIEEEVTLHVLQALLDAGYHTRHTPNRSSRPIEDEVAFLRDRVIPFLKRGASWPRASKLLNKLSKNPNDSKTLKSLEDMIGTTNPGFTRDEALDALANIAFSSEGERAAAVDSAIDAVRDVFDA